MTARGKLGSSYENGKDADSSLLSDLEFNAYPIMLIMKTLSVPARPDQNEKDAGAVDRCLDRLLNIAAKRDVVYVNEDRVLTKFAS